MKLQNNKKIGDFFKNISISILMMLGKTVGHLK